MIVVQSLTKTFRQQIAVDHVSFTVNEGKIFGLLGPNGAGKTTLLKLLCGLLKADSGTLQIDGKSIAQAKYLFGYVAQHFGHYAELSVIENLNFYAELYGIDDHQRLEHLIQHYGLAPYRDSKAGQLSGGYKRRLALVCALIHDPKILFLDEPTSGIDPVTRKQLWDDLYALSSEGKTIIVTTHYMEEAQRCHTLGFLVNGRLVAQGTPDDLRQQLGDVKVFATQQAYLPALHQALKKLDNIILINQFGNELRIMGNADLSAEQISPVLQQTCNSEPELVASSANIEDVFIALSQLQEAAQ